MGLTIEEAIEIISDIDKAYRTFSNIEYKALRKALESMCKYQKIQEIIADWKSDGGVFEMTESYWLRLISEVIENGKID